MQQFRLHVGVVVRDIQADQALAFIAAACRRSSACRWRRSMTTTSVAHPVAPLQGRLGVRRQPGGIGLDARPVGEQPFGAGTTQAVAAADEQDPVHGRLSFAGAAGSMTSSPRFGVAPRRFSRDGAASGACRNTVTRVAWGGSGGWRRWCHRPRRIPSAAGHAHETQHLDLLLGVEVMPLRRGSAPPPVPRSGARGRRDGCAAVRAGRAPLVAKAEHQLALGGDAHAVAVAAEIIAMR